MGRKYEQAFDGVWQRIVKRGYAFACCDCAKVHIIDHREVEGTLEVRYRTDNRATAALRRKFNFTPDEE